jgi:hypothetical protein
MKNESTSTLRVVENPADQSASPTTIRPAAKKPKKILQAKPVKILPSDRVASEKQLDILRAYAAASGPGNNSITIEEVAKVADVAASTIKLLNAFFCDVGLIQRLEQKAGKFIPSSEVCSFAKSFEWNRETAAQKLAPVLVNTWFSDPLMRKLSFQPIDEKQALIILAEKAEAGPGYEPQLRVLLDYLQASGLIQRENGIIRSNKQVSATAQPEHEPAGTDAAPKEAPAVKSSLISTAFSNAAQGVVNFHVDVKINMSEFAQWSPDRISSFFAGIAQVLAAKGAIEKEGSKDA